MHDINPQNGNNRYVSGPLVLVLEDDDFTRTLMVGTLAGLGFQNVYAASTASEVTQLASKVNIHVALLDLDLGEGPTGVDVAEHLRRKNPLIGLVFLSSFPNPRMAGNHRELPVGSIYLSKNDVADPGSLEVAIKEAHESPLASSHKTFLTRTLKRAPKLSGKQIDVMRLVALGYTNSEIARRQNSTERAVEKSIRRLAAALGISSQPGRNLRVLIAGAYFHSNRQSS